jgi:gas vesicle protein
MQGQTGIQAMSAMQMMGSTGAATRRSRRMRVMAALLSVALVAPACTATGGANEANLTPAQRQLREQNQRWWQTTGTGAAAGAAAGVAAGALIGSGNRQNQGTAMLIGGLLGALAGSVAGVTLANRTLGFENNELGANQRIQSAQQTAAGLEQQARAAEQVSTEHARRLEVLDRQFRARQITAEQYRTAAAPIRQDKELMESNAAEARNVRQRMNTQRGQLPEISAAEARMGPAQRSLEASAAQLDDLLRRVPAG